MKVVFPFYDDLQKQNRFRAVVQKRGEHYSLISGADRFLPFIIRRDITGELITCVKVRKSSDDSVAYYINVEDFSYKLYTTSSAEYIIYYGALIDGLLMACNSYYLDIDGWYSEVFTVKQQLTDYLLLEFSNETPIGGILYQTGFVQRLYLDAEIEVAEPFRDEETDQDGYGNEFFTFKKLIPRYSFDTNVIPEYLYNALSLLDMHKIVDVYEGEYAFEGIRRIDPKFKSLTPASFIINFTFEENWQAVSKDCPDDEILEEVDQTGYEYRPWLCDPSAEAPWEADPDSTYCLQGWEVDPDEVYCVQDA